MELMPGYKYSDIGYVPEDWDVKRLCNFASVATGSTPPTSDVTNYGYEFLFVSPVDMGEAKLITRTEKKLSPKGFSISRKFPRGSILFVCIGSTIGKCGIASIELTSNQQINAIFPSPIFSEDYLYYAMVAAAPRVRVLAGEQAVPLVNKTQFSETYVPLPPLPEQRAIAKALSDADELLATLDQVIAKKRDLKQAAMQQLLTGEKRLPRFYGDWELKSFDDLFDFSGGYSASRDQLSNEGHCYLHYGDIHGSSKTSVNTRRDFLDIPKLSISLGRISECSLLKHGDVVFVDASEDDAGTSKHLVIENEDDVPFISGLHTIVAKSKANDLAHAYKHYCFQTPAIRQQFMFYAVGTKVSGISKTNIAKLTLSIPSIPEQIAIADVLSSMDVELANLEARRAKTLNIKQAMMQELLTGKMRLVEPRGANA
jgi:type I restriction enzyme S subunit